MCLFNPQHKGECDHQECKDFYQDVVKRPPNRLFQSQPEPALGKRKHEEELQEVNDQPSSEQNHSNYQTASTDPTLGHHNHDAGGALDVVVSGRGGTGSIVKPNKLGTKSNTLANKPFMMPRPGTSTHSLNGEGDRHSLFNQLQFSNVPQPNLNPAFAGLEGLIKGSRAFPVKDGTPTPLGAFQMFPSATGKSEDSSGDLIVSLLNELRPMSKLLIDLHEKVDIHNKMLSILMKEPKYVR